MINVIFMNKKILASVTMFALMLVYMLPFSVDTANVPEATAAQSDYFLELDGIEGESVLEGKEKQMQIESWSFGASNPTSVGSSGMSAGKVQFQDFNFMKQVGKATPKLMLACANGKHFPKATLSVVRPSADRPTTYAKYTFTDIMVTSCKQSADPIMESISFNYAKIEMSYTPTTSDGTAGKPVTAGWDLAKGKAF